MYVPPALWWWSEGRLALAEVSAAEEAESSKPGSSSVESANKEIQRRPGDLSDCLGNANTGAKNFFATRHGGNRSTCHERRLATGQRTPTRRATPAIVVKPPTNRTKRLSVVPIRKPVLIVGPDEVSK